MVLVTPSLRGAMAKKCDSRVSAVQRSASTLFGRFLRKARFASTIAVAKKRKKGPAP
jgi:hypothetical protein